MSRKGNPLFQDQSGPKHPRWKGGVYRHEEGYRRYSAGPSRGKLVHRVIIETLDKEGPCHLRGKLSDAEVHHINGNRECSCPWNLLVLFDGIHEAFTAPYASKRAVAKKKLNEKEDDHGND